MRFNSVKKLKNIMKKIVILFLVAASVTAQAQFTVGINTGFDRFGRGETGSKSYTLVATPNLLLGYRINNHLTVGLTGSLLYFGDITNNDITLPEPPADGSWFNYERTKRSVDKGTAWSAGAYARYDIPLTDHLSLFAHLSVSFGKANSSYSREYIFYNTDIRDFDYDRDISLTEVTLVPGVSYRFSTHLSADLYLNLLQIAYTHTTLVEHPQAEPADKASSDDKVTYSSFTFGNNLTTLMNLSMGSYGISINNLSSFRIGVNYTF